MEQVRSVEENIGIRKSSRFLPVVATFVTAFFFLAAIQNKGKSDLAGNPIEIGEFEIPEGSEWVDLNSSLLRTQNARFTPTDTIESGTVVGGEAKYRLQDKTLYVKAAKSNPQNVSDIRGEMVRITYQYSGSKHKNSSEGHWEAHKKFWDVYGDLEEANKRIDKLTAQFFDSSTKDKKIPGSILSSLISISHPLAKVFAFDLPRVLAFLFKLGWVIAFYALFPGLAGMFYRRNFQRYFLFAAAFFFAIEIAFQIPGWGSVAQDKKEGLIFPYGFYQVALGALAGIFLLMRTRICNPFRGPLSRLKAAISGKSGEKGSEAPAKPGKNIVVCLDGSWNTPGQLEHGQLASTNVFKLFRMLKGSRLPLKKLLRTYNANIAKHYQNPERPDHSQVGLYYNGVGNNLENSTCGNGSTPG